MIERDDLIRRAEACEVLARSPSDLLAIERWMYTTDLPVHECAQRHAGYLRRQAREAASAPDANVLAEALSLLRALVDPSECRYDHHGYCQTHTLDDAPCPHSRGRDLLARLDQEARDR